MCVHCAFGEYHSLMDVSVELDAKYAAKYTEYEAMKIQINIISWKATLFVSVCLVVVERIIECSNDACLLYNLKGRQCTANYPYLLT